MGFQRGSDRFLEGSFRGIDWLLKGDFARFGNVAGL